MNLRCKPRQRCLVLKSAAGNAGRIVRTVCLFGGVEDDCAPAWIVVSEGTALHCTMPPALRGPEWLRDAWLQPLPDEEDLAGELRDVPACLGVEHG